MLLHDTCLPVELAKPANQTVIAATFKDCNGADLTPGTQLLKCSDLPAAADGSETKVTPGANVTVTGTGTTASPYVVTANIPAATTDCPAVVACIDALPLGPTAVPGTTRVLGDDMQYHLLPIQATAAAPDGSETKVTAGTNVTVTGTGTTASPYVVNAAAAAVADGSETKVTAGTNVTVTGSGTTAAPYVVNAAAAGAPTLGTGVPATGPTAAPVDPNVRNFATSVIGENWEYLPGLGWRVVSDRYTREVINAIPAVLTANTPTLKASTIAPRAGTIIATGFVAATNGNYNSIGASLTINGVVKCSNAVDIIGPTGGSAAGGAVSSAASLSAIGAFTGVVAAGDVIGMSVNSVGSNGTHNGSIIRITYIN